MIRLKQLIEAVPISKTDVIQKRLEKKFSNLESGTFGIDMEYSPSEIGFNADLYKEEIMDNMLSARNWRSNRDVYGEWLNKNRESANRLQFNLT